MKLTNMMIALAALAAGTLTAQPTSNNNGSVTTATTAQPVQLVNVVSDPRWVMTTPVGKLATINFRALLSDGRNVNDFSQLGLVFNISTSDGALLTGGEVACKPQIAQCRITSTVPRTVYISVSSSVGGLGYAGVVINFFRPGSGYPATIDVTSSQVQANDGTSPTLIVTSPISSPGPVSINVSTRFERDDFNKQVYLPDGVEQGQRIPIAAEDVHPLSFRDRKSYTVTMSGPENYVIAQGFGSSVGSIEVKNVDAAIEDNGDLVFTLNEPYSASVEYKFSILRGNRFRVELAQSRAELFSYPYGSKTKVVVNKGSLGGNRFELPAGAYTVSMAAFDRASGIGWSNSRADALNVDSIYVIR